MRERGGRGERGEKEGKERRERGGRVFLRGLLFTKESKRE